MFGLRQSSLALARQEHEQALNNLQSARADFQQQRSAFVGKPANLCFPFTAGLLVAASQVKNVPKGIGRLPFLNIAKSGIGAYALLMRFKSINQLSQAADEV